MIYHATHGKESKLPSSRLYTATDMEEKIKETVAIINQVLHCFNFNRISIESRSSVEDIAVEIIAWDYATEVRRKIIIGKEKNNNEH